MKQITLATLLIGLALGNAYAQSTSPPAPPAPLSAGEEHVLGRTGYGHDWWTRKRIQDLGWRDYVEEQLFPDKINDAPLERELAQDPRTRAFRLTFQQLTAKGVQAGGYGPNNQFTYRNGLVRQEAQYEFFLRGLHSRRQLEALMTEFWLNHLNVDAGGGQVSRYFAHYVQAIRANAFGRFEDLLIASAKSPSMSFYLNNNQSKKGAINENYAREVMELHTFGQDDQQGTYEHGDIVALAKILTGWGVDNASTTDGFRFRGAQHEGGDKVFLGKTYANNTAEPTEGVAALRALARHPRTARNISAKLARFFVVGPARADLVKRATDTYLKTKGNLRAVLRVILKSKEFMAPENRRTKVKRPHQLLISAMRSVGTKTLEENYEDRKKLVNRLANYTEQLGLRLFMVPPPTGWSDRNDTWISEGTMLARVTLLRTLYNNGAVRAEPNFKPNASKLTDKELVQAFKARILQNAPMAGTTRVALVDYLAARKFPDPALKRSWTMTLVFSSPEFGRY